MKKQKTSFFATASALLLAAFLSLFVLYPIWMSLRLSLKPEGVWSLDNYINFFRQPELAASLWNSILLGAVVASLSSVVGYSIAFLLCRTQVRGKKLIRALSLLPMISPPFMLTLSLILLFGRSGLITRDLLGLDEFSVYGFHGLVLIQTLSFFPLAYLSLQSVLLSIDGSLEEAALDLGASKWHTFWTITFPLSTPGIASAWLIVFVSSLSDFANPLILGGNFEVLSVAAYNQFTGFGNLSLGAALSNVLIVPCLAAFLLQRLYLQKRSFVTVTGKPSRRIKDLSSPLVRSALLFVSWIFLGFNLLLYASVLAGCFTEAFGQDYSLSLKHFAYLGSVGWPTIVDTVLLAAIATPLAGLLGIFIAFLCHRYRFTGRRALEASSLLAFALPGTAVGIGFVLAFNQAPLLLTQTAAIIVICHIVRNMPLSIEAGKSALTQIDKSIEEAAMDLGAKPLQVFKDITLPLLRPALFAGMAYVFVQCMTAVSAIIFLVSVRWKHMTELIYARIEQFDFGAASILCVLLILIVLFVFWFLEKIIGVKRFSQKVVSH